MFLVSCKKNNTIESSLDNSEVENTIEEFNEYDKLASIVKDDLYELGSRLKVEKSNFSDQGTVFKIGEMLYEKDSAALEMFTHNYINAKNNSFDFSNISDKVINYISIIDSKLQQTSSSEEYISILNSEFNSLYFSKDFSEDDKHLILKYLKIQQVAIEYLQFNHAAIYSTNAKNWWGDWGKCAAGIVGEGILGALGGAAAGSVIPGLGTTAGAIVGGIGGALAGAASSC